MSEPNPPLCEMTVYTPRRSELPTGGTDPPSMKLSCMLGRRRH